MSHSFFRSHIVQIAVISLLVFFGIMGIRSQGFLQALELEAYDLSLQLRPDRTSQPLPVTIVTITEEDIRELGHWPISDELLAKALTRIHAYHPRAIGVDMYRDLEVPPGRPRLNNILREYPEIVMVKKFGKLEEGGIAGPDVLRGTDRVGFSDMVVDADGVVRRGLLFLDDGTTVSRSFPFLLAMKYLKSEEIKPNAAEENPDWLQLGQQVLIPFESNDGGYVQADAQGYQILLNLERKDQTFPTLSLQTVLAGKMEPELIHDRLVLLGVVSEGVKDFFYTSQCGKFTSCPHVSGIELHGHVVAQLLQHAQTNLAPIATLSELLEGWWLAFWVFAGGLVGLWVRGAWRFSVIVLFGLSALGVVVVWAMANSWWLPWVPPAMGWVVNAMVVTALISKKEQKDRQVLMGLFARHVSSQVAEAIWEQREQFLEKGRWRPQTLVVTTLFTDLEGFTTVAEKMPPDQLWEWLNTYMNGMVKMITDHGGLIDDYYGDMIKAGFGVLTREQTDEQISQNAREAVKCGLAIEQEIIQLNNQWRQQGLPSIRMRIGINTGPVMVGSLGSAERLKFTTIGDAVNIAARLENLDKDVWKTEDPDTMCRILIGEKTKQSLGTHPWFLKEVRSVMLKGKTQGLPIYRLYAKDREPLVQ